LEGSEGGKGVHPTPLHQANEENEEFCPAPGADLPAFYGLPASAPSCKVRLRTKSKKAMEIIEYKTAVSTDIANLDKVVNELIKKGFHPFGTPYFVPKNAHGVVIDYTVCQAMVSTGESIKTVQANQANVEVETEQVKMAKEAKKALDQQIAKVLS
jgi:hypothetical protein